MQGQMAERFLQYNQEQMTEKFQLPCDENYIYVTFVSSLYRINRQTGEIQVQEPERKDWGKTDYNEAMSIYDVLCDSKPDCHLSGRFVSLNSLKGTVFSSGTVGNIFQKYTGLLTERPGNWQKPVKNWEGSRSRQEM